MTAEFQFALEPQLDPAEFIDVMTRSTLAKRRPPPTRDSIRQLLVNSDIVATARHAGLLVGVSRAITDFSQCVYLADLAVDVAFQRRGIGRELVEQTHSAAGKHTLLVLLAAPAAAMYYPHIGLQPHPSCWTIPRQPAATPHV
jgi:ribosomal protein S18 acetylase RimI-like enzyme